ncbi:MAG TPA: hypothetical protein VIT45_10100 [Allosphingosinicella sp.]
MNRFALPFALLAFVSACADSAEQPRADPAQVELAVARMEAESVLPPAVAEKVEKADRISGAVLKVAPEKIDPNVAAALIGR